MKFFSLNLQRLRLRWIIFGLILSLFFSGAGTLTSLPLFYATLAHAHPVFVAEVDQKLRLTFHHPGNHDSHENALRPRLRHRHDFFDQALSFSRNGKTSHRDHVIELTSFEAQDSTTPKNGVIKAKRVALPQALPLSVKVTAFGISSPSPPRAPSLPGFIRRTVLII